MRLTSGRAKTTSVIDAINRRAGHRGQLASTYPYNSKQSIPAALRVIRLQQRCNLDSRRDVRTRFSIEFAIWRGRWRRPCVKYRFNSYTSRGLTAACRLYIQNEGLRENFWEDRANEDAKRCCSPFITAGSQPAQAQFVTITEEEAGQRIDNYLLRVCKGVPKSHIYRILRSGEVRVNKGRIDQLYRLVDGDVVRIPPVRVAEKSSAAVPGAEFTILFEDAHLLVIDKPCRHRGARRLGRVVRRHRAVARLAPGRQVPRTGAPARPRNLGRADAGEETLGADQPARADARRPDRQALPDRGGRRLEERAPAHQAAAAQVHHRRRRAAGLRAGRRHGIAHRVHLVAEMGKFRTCWKPN